MHPDNLLGADAYGIARTLDAFELFIDELERGVADARDLDRFATLLERVVEPHCAREEALLLAAMAVGGVAAGAEELSEARVQRSKARELLCALRSAGPDAGSLARPRSVIARAKSYATLVRSHLGWFRRVVRPLVERRLSPEQTRALGAGGSIGEQLELEALAEELIEAYSERPTSVQPAS